MPLCTQTFLCLGSGSRGEGEERLRANVGVFEKGERGEEVETAHK